MRTKEHRGRDEEGRGAGRRGVLEEEDRGRGAKEKETDKREKRKGCRACHMPVKPRLKEHIAFNSLLARPVKQPRSRIAFQVAIILTLPARRTRDTLPDLFCNYRAKLVPTWSQRELPLLNGCVAHMTACFYCITNMPAYIYSNYQGCGIPGCKGTHPCPAT